MRIKIDENIPAAVISDLSGLGHDVCSVHQQGLKGTPIFYYGKRYRLNKDSSLRKTLTFQTLRNFSQDPMQGFY